MSTLMPQIKWNWTTERKICSKADAAALLIQEILDRMQAMGWSQKEQLDTHLCLEEAFMNAIKHGNRNDCEKCVLARCWISNQNFRIEIHDEGPGFCPAAVPDPTCDENLENCSGRGLKLMQHFMDSIEYNDKGNVVTMQKKRRATA